MRYAEARLDEYERDKAYRIYVTRSLQLAPQNKCLQIPFSDLLDERNSRKVETRNGDEIVADVMLKAGLKFEE